MCVVCCVHAILGVIWLVLDEMECEMVWEGRGWIGAVWDGKVE